MIKYCAMKAGVDFFRAWKMWLAYQYGGLVTKEIGRTFAVVDWFNVFCKTMAMLPPKLINQYLSNN